MITLINLGLLYLALIMITVLHEIGHVPTRHNIKLGLFSFPNQGGIRIKLLPLPEGSSMASSFRYGGIIVNFIILYLVYHFKPELLLLQLIGLVSFFHFVLYCIFGSINKELGETTIMRNPQILKYWVFDDIPNSLGFFFFPLGILTFLLFQEYYLPILINLFM